MYAKNSNGPNTVPCGTPLMTAAGDDVKPSHTTRWVRPERNASTTTVTNKSVSGQNQTFKQKLYIYINKYLYSWHKSNL